MVSMCWMVVLMMLVILSRDHFFFSSRRRHTRCSRDWSQTCALPIFRALWILPLRLPNLESPMGSSRTLHRHIGRIAQPHHRNPPGISDHQEVGDDGYHHEYARNWRWSDVVDVAARSISCCQV